MHRYQQHRDNGKALVEALQKSGSNVHLDDEGFAEKCMVLFKQLLAEDKLSAVLEPGSEVVDVLKALKRFMSKEWVQEADLVLKAIATCSEVRETSAAVAALGSTADEILGHVQYGKHAAGYGRAVHKLKMLKKPVHENAMYGRVLEQAKAQLTEGMSSMDVLSKMVVVQHEESVKKQAIDVEASVSNPLLQEFLDKHAALDG